MKQEKRKLSFRNPDTSFFLHLDECCFSLALSELLGGASEASDDLLRRGFIFDSGVNSL